MIDNISTGANWGSGFRGDDDVPQESPVVRYEDAAEAIRDAYCGVDEAPPEWAFACDPQHFALDVDDMIENLCSDGYEDMESNQTIPKSLRKAVDHFNKINAKWLVAWHADFTRKIRIPKLKDED